jgi:tetratricopeptide (TPR) repeat protein
LNINHDRNHSLSILNLGAVYSYQGLDDSALVYFNKSLELSIEAGDFSSQAIYLMNIGSIYDNMDLLDKSFIAMRQSLYNCI